MQELKLFFLQSVIFVHQYNRHASSECRGRLTVLCLRIIPPALAPNRTNQFRSWAKHVYQHYPSHSQHFHPVRQARRSRSVCLRHGRTTSITTTTDHTAAASAALQSHRDTSTTTGKSSSSILDEDGRLSSASASTPPFALHLQIPKYPLLGTNSVLTAHRCRSITEIRSSSRFTLISLYWRCQTSVRWCRSKFSRLQQEAS